MRFSAKDMLGAKRSRDSQARRLPFSPRLVYGREKPNLKHVFPSRVFVGSHASGLGGGSGGSLFLAVFLAVRLIRNTYSSYGYLASNIDFISLR